MALGLTCSLWCPDEAAHLSPDHSITICNQHEGNSFPVHGASVAPTDYHTQLEGRSVWECSHTHNPGDEHLAFLLPQLCTYWPAFLEGVGVHLPNFKDFMGTSLSGCHFCGSTSPPLSFRHPMYSHRRVWGRHLFVKTTLERCGPFSLVVLSQRRSQVTPLSGHSDQNASETFSNKLQLNKVQSSLRQTSAKTTQVRSKAKTS